MNWLIIISNVSFAFISASLCALSWNTLKAIKYLNVGKLFWIPLFLSSFLFVICGLITILNDVFLSLTTAFEIEQITQLIAIGFLSVGIFSYSKIIRMNIPENKIVPEEFSSKKSKVSPYSPITSSTYFKKDASNVFEKRTSPECNHQLGYLTTFPADASLPEECLSCDKVIECKKS
jgi:hypothetical protein